MPSPGNCIDCGVWQSNGKRLRCRVCNTKFMTGRKQKRKMDERVRFSQFFVKTNGCWEWIGGLFSNGYGRFTDAKNGSSHVLAHRRSFQLFRELIPSGLFVCHSCDNKRCVRPDHLWLGTAKDNSQDMHSKGRDRNQFSKVGKNI
jgi:hypothetical protein